MTKLLGKYNNGNYSVSIYEDGTKIRFSRGDAQFVPTKPESMDLKITNQCDIGCPMCHENSTKNGQHGDILHLPFLDSLNPYTEIAIGGGNPLSHPDLLDFLTILKDKRLIANMTVNQKHFMDHKDQLLDLCEKKLIYGLGVSVTSTPNRDILNSLLEFDNLVVHVINGMVSPIDLIHMKDKGFKILILGYKTFRRGEAYYEAMSGQVKYRMEAMYKNLPNIINWFDVVSFDNLAIKQLDVKRMMSEEEWEKFYMGDDGTFTMYVDAVSGEYAASSISTKRHKITENIDDMFKTILEERA